MKLILLFNLGEFTISVITIQIDISNKMILIIFNFILEIDNGQIKRLILINDDMSD